MPHITTISIAIKNRTAPQVEAALLDVSHAPLDDLPLVTSVEDGIELLRHRTRGGLFCFRIPDEPSVIVAWHSFGTAAVVHTLRQKRLAHIDIILLGSSNDPSVIEQVKSEMGLTEEEVAKIGGAARPLLVRMSHGGEKGIADLLGLILLVPMLCEAIGVE